MKVLDNGDDGPWIDKERQHQQLLQRRYHEIVKSSQVMVKNPLY